MTKEPLPAPPFRPLPKIVARGPGIEPTSDLQLGDKVNVLMKPFHAKPFWRLYEVALIDGGMCRLVTPDKRFAMNAETPYIKELRDLQRQLK